ncbi:MAG TPA: helix-hairpin-helix domain-containing protein [Flavobacteriaceae bacterium]|nr:helix-hairpin-helix domain-containing protein [Flavobacteriaceae bacterium]HEX5743415.1 helix-hairpin-helix domain-containing protein [Flavobacteriaceae bacterium]
MKELKSLLLFNARQRKGILILLFIVVALQLTFFLVDFSSYSKLVNNDKEVYYQRKIDSLKSLALITKTPSANTFNPNYITDFKGYQLGMSTMEIDLLLNYRAKGKFVNSANEFQQITKISDSLLNELKPLFKFPNWVENAKKDVIDIKKSSNKIDIKIKDINKATEADLMRINGIGEVLAKRIIQYRNKIGGFTYNYQLYEVWNLDKTVADKVLQQFRTVEKPEIKKLNINTASFKEVLAIVYIDYELCKKIFNHKKEIAEYQTLEELKKIEGFPIDKYELIILYLDVK